MESFPRHEQGPKRAPTQEKVVRLLQQILSTDDLEARTEERICMLEDGETPYECSFIIKNPDGTSREYTYSLEGNFTQLPNAPRNAASKHTAIYVAYFDADGVPAGGEQLAGITGGPDAALEILKD